jgi:hypothetical protein
MAQSMLRSLFPIETDIDEPLNINEVYRFSAQHSETARPDVTPYRPKGGVVYIFVPTSDATKHDWRADGHQWSNNGVKKLPKKDYFEKLF